LADEWSNVRAEDALLINAAMATERFAGTQTRVFRGLYDTTTRGIEFSAKLNHQAGEKDTLTARYAFSRGRLRHEVQGPDNFA
jgi:hypothetical protein